jgi:hypothetical protein
VSDPSHYSVLLIVDRSASILPFRGPMVHGLREMVLEQANGPGLGTLTTITVVEFDSDVEVTYVLADPALVRFGLHPRGRTALYDAIGHGIFTLREAIAELPEHARPAGVQVVVVTDGAENASVEFTEQKIRQFVKHQRKTHGWRFMLLAANQDASVTGTRLGFDDDNFTFVADAEGATLMTQTITHRLRD